MFLITAVSVIVLLVFLDHCYRKIVYKSALLLPNLDIYTFPLIGQAHSFIGNGEARMANFKNFAEQTTKLGGVARYWLGTRLFLLVTDPDVAEMVLRTFLEKDQLMDICRDLTGNGTIFAPVSIWRPRRKLLMHAFSLRILNNFVGLFAEASEEMNEKLEKKSSGAPFSLFPYLSGCTMKSVCESNLGVPLSLENENVQTFTKTFEKAARYIAVRLTQPWLNSIYTFLPQFKIFCEQRELLYKFINQVIQSKKQEKEHEWEVISKADHKAQPGRRSFLDMLMDQSESAGLSDTDLRDECMVITLAGTDTSAVGASFFLCMMARHPHVQDKLYEELTEVFGNSNRAVTHKDLPKLQYLDAALRETLRLYPPVPVIVRRVDKYISLKSGETLVPGMGILINIWGIHRNPKYWGPDADKFRPDRFLNSAPPHPVAFLPFSQGPRNCIGYQYAMMSMKTTLATILRRFRVLPVSGLDASSRGPENQFINNNVDDKPMRVQFDVMMKDIDHFTIQLETRKVANT